MGVETLIYYLDCGLNTAASGYQQSSFLLIIIITATDNQCCRGAKQSLLETNKTCSTGQISTLAAVGF